MKGLEPASYSGQFALSVLPGETWNRIFPTSLTGDVTSEITEDKAGNEAGLEPLFHKQVSLKFSNFPHLPNDLQMLHLLATKLGHQNKISLCIYLRMFLFPAKGYRNYNTLQEEQTQCPLSACSAASALV